MSARDLAYAGMFGAASLLLPVIFHLLQLGHALMPMYVPLVALAFLVSAPVAMTTATLIPLLSAVVTGMPPLYPPIAPIMAIELAMMCGLIAAAIRVWPTLHLFVVLLPVLIAGRFLNLALSYAAAALLELPAQFVGTLSFLAGWPGVLLMMFVIPPLVRAIGVTGMRQSE